MTEHTCTYCGVTGTTVRVEVVHVGGRGDVRRFRCTAPDPVIGWRYAHTEDEA